MASVLWSLGALDDLQEIVAFISKDSAHYAAAVGGRIVAAVERLEDYPRLGRTVPEYGDENIRELIVDSYRIIYRLQNDTIGIAVVVHGSRDLLRRLAGEDWDFG